MHEKSFALVIDDSVSMRQYVTSILRQDGRLGEVLEAENPDHALRLLQSYDGRLLFIVSDWNMPGMSLGDFLRSIQLRPRLAGAPVFLLTAENETKAQFVAAAIGASAVLTKPFKAEELLNMVAAVIGIDERRRAKRIQPLVSCDVDLGFSEEQQTYSGEIIDISETGILLRSPVPPSGVGYIYDYATILLRPVTGETMKLYGQIIRLEAEKQHRDEAATGRQVLIAFDFGRMDSATREQLQHYIMLSDATNVSGDRN